jgi:hypothetical protein
LGPTTVLKFPLVLLLFCGGEKEISMRGISGTGKKKTGRRVKCLQTTAELRYSHPWK